MRHPMQKRHQESEYVILEAALASLEEEMTSRDRLVQQAPGTDRPVQQREVIGDLDQSNFDVKFCLEKGMWYKHVQLFGEVFL